MTIFLEHNVKLGSSVVSRPGVLALLASELKIHFLWPLLDEVLDSIVLAEVVVSKPLGYHLQ